MGDESDATQARRKRPRSTDSFLLSSKLRHMRLAAANDVGNRVINCPREKCREKKASPILHQHSNVRCATSASTLNHRTVHGSEHIGRNPSSSCNVSGNRFELLTNHADQTRPMPFQSTQIAANLEATHEAARNSKRSIPRQYNPSRRI